jgi:hypothetical protein
LEGRGHSPTHATSTMVDLDRTMII